MRMAVLLSGSGRTLQNFIKLSDSGYLKADVSGVISSRPDAYGVQRAKQAGIPNGVISPGKFDDTPSFSQAITAALSQWEPELIAMAGFLSFYEVPPQLTNKVMNIHPALLPAFGGKGYYGDKVHRAVLEYGCKISGCTVHFANNKYDHGPVILQKAVTVTETDDAHSLADKVFEIECQLYPQAINLFAEKRLKVSGRRVKILDKATNGRIVGKSKDE